MLSMYHLKLLYIAGLISILMLSVQVNGNTYYVSPSGDNENPGTLEEPWESVGKAAHTVIAGDTVLIREGTYHEAVVIQHSGDGENPIVFMGFDQEKVIMDGNTHLSSIFYIPQNFIEIHNIRFQNVNSWGILIENCHHVIIRDCSFWHTLLSGIRAISASDIEIMNNTMHNAVEDEHWGGGIWASYGSRYLISGNHISDCLSYGIRTDDIDTVDISDNYTFNTFHSGIAGFSSDTIRIHNNEIVLACNGSYDECLSLEDCDHFYIYNNEVHTSGDVEQGAEGIAVGAGCRYGEIYNNYIHHLDKTGLYVDGWDTPTYDIKVYGNVLDSCNQGIAIGSEKGGPVENVSVFRNVICHSVGYGINIASWVNDGLRKNIRVFNNTIYKNGTYIYYCGGIMIESSNVENISVLNNICSENLQLQIGVNTDALDEVTVEYNLINGEQVHDLSFFGEHYIEDSPGFVDATSLNLELSENSPARDAGHPDTQYNDPDGTRNDMGAYYYNPVLSVDNVTTENISSEYIFCQNHPNPFSSSTEILYHLPGPGIIEIAIYNILGEKLETLFYGFREAGMHQIIWEPTNISKGMYYCNLYFANHHFRNDKKGAIKIVYM